jgi:ribA/ribD-fused uncharacterized protein
MNKFETNWSKIAIHDDSRIYGFFGEYRYLSNFHLSPVYFEKLLYPSSENAFQAAKVVYEHRYVLTECSPSESKKVWKTLPTLYTPENWDKIKYNIMARILAEKFGTNAQIREMLVNTGNKDLSEYNWWQDTYWGYDVNKNEGQNNLGKILMKIRTLYS